MEPKTKLFIRNFLAIYLTIILCVVGLVGLLGLLIFIAILTKIPIGFVLLGFTILFLFAVLSAAIAEDVTRRGEKILWWRKLMWWRNNEKENTETNQS